MAKAKIEFNSKELLESSSSPSPVPSSHEPKVVSDGLYPVPHSSHPLIPHVVQFSPHTVQVDTQPTTLANLFTQPHTALLPFGSFVFSNPP